MNSGDKGAAHEAIDSNPIRDAAHGRFGSALGEGYIALKDVAERQNISKKYLEQIVSLLMNHGLLKATRGFSGGYQLAEEPGRITAAEVVRATENSLNALPCIVDADACDRREKCPTLSLWSGLEGVIIEYLKGITLADLAAKEPAGR